MSILLVTTFLYKVYTWNIKGMVAQVQRTLTKKTWHAPSVMCNNVIVNQNLGIIRVLTCIRLLPSRIWFVWSDCCFYVWAALSVSPYTKLKPALLMVTGKFSHRADRWNLILSYPGSDWCNIVYWNTPFLALKKDYAKTNEVYSGFI